MSYRFNKEDKSLIIDGFENGIANSPYNGIANIRNLNTSYYPGVAYTNYCRQATTMTSETPITFDSFNQGTTYSAPTLNTGLVSYWKLDESSGNAVDSVGINTLTNNNGVTYSAGKINNGANFASASSQFLSITDASQSGLDITGDMSFACWLKCSNTNQFVSKSLSTGNQNSWQARVTPTSSFEVFTSADGSTVKTATFSTAVFTINTWHHVVITYTASAHSIEMFVDGSSIGTVNNSANVASSLFDSSSDFRLGLGNPGGGEYLNGSMDEVGIWNKVLTSTEVTTLYNSGNGVQYNFGATNTFSYSHTCSGSNRLLLIATQVMDGDTISSVTYNAIPATLIGSSALGNTSGQRVAIYGLLNPSLGINQVVVTRDKYAGIMGACSISYVGVKQSGLPDATTTQTGTTSVTTTITTVVNNSFAVAYTAGSATISAGTGSTLIGRPNRTDSTAYGLFSYSSNPKTPAGSTAMATSSSTVGSTVAQIMLSFAPVNQPPTITNPVQEATSPAGLNYILDDSGNIWKQSAVNSSTFALLGNGTGRISNGASGLAYWNNYLVVFGNGLIEFCGNGSGDAGIISTNWNLNTSGNARNTATFTTNYAVNANNLIFTYPYYTLFVPKFSVNDPVQFTTTGTLPAGLSLNTTYYIKSITYNTASGGPVTVSTSIGGSAVTLTSDGTGTHTITDFSRQLPLGNCTKLVLAGTLNQIVTAITFSSYVNTIGVTQGSTWQEATGIYNIVFPDGTKMPASFTFSSGTINLLSNLIYVQATTDGDISIELIDPDVTNYRPYVSKVDGSLYYCNGQFIGRLAITNNPNIVFNPGLPVTYSVNGTVTALPELNIDTVVDMVDLKNNLVVAGQKKIYTWDYLSAACSSPAPVDEQIIRITNVLNNIYILAGQKGNIYISNGYSASLFYKIPDFIAGVIDAVWSYGGIMSRRSKLWFQTLAKTTAGTNILAGVFSLEVTGEPKLVQESQNSYGLTPASGALSNGCLIDNSPSSTGYDSYYSAWSNGATTGGIDYNDTSLWQNWEPTIETDIIPIGTILDKKTFGNFEFKLDRPMTTGDQIRIYWRPSLTDSYTLLGTTTTTQLSDYYPSNISQAQWAQFKVQMKCASSGSSRIPLREVRLYYN